MKNTTTTSPQIVVIAHNIRSTHNVGSILRTCEGFGVTTVYLTGYTPSPVPNETQINSKPVRYLPHIQEKINKAISKVALGAEVMLEVVYNENVGEVLATLKKSEFFLYGLEQAPESILLSKIDTGHKRIALMLGEEVDGIAITLQESLDGIVEIPMFGEKESFNVSVACGIALYELRRS
jgi:23S rRNA (guanosine2251-2'-O)-methyltransferase